MSRAKSDLSTCCILTKNWVKVSVNKLLYTVAVQHDGYKQMIRQVLLCTLN